MQILERKLTSRSSASLPRAATVKVGPEGESGGWGWWCGRGDVAWRKAWIEVREVKAMAEKGSRE